MEAFIMNLLEKVEHELLVLENQSEKIEDHSETAISILHRETKHFPKRLPI